MFLRQTILFPSRWIIMPLSLSFKWIFRVPWSELITPRQFEGKSENLHSRECLLLGDQEASILEATFLDTLLRQRMKRLAMTSITAHKATPAATPPRILAASSLWPLCSVDMRHSGVSLLGNTKTSENWTTPVLYYGRVQLELKAPAHRASWCANASSLTDSETRRAPIVPQEIMSVLMRHGRSEQYLIKNHCQKM